MNSFLRNLNHIRLMKQSLMKIAGRFWLRFAAKYPSIYLLEKMRNCLGIQLTSEELMLITSALRRKSRVNLLVFGTGNDSEYWFRLNSSGKTVFLENDPSWVRNAKSIIPGLDVRHIEYNTVRSQWCDLLKDEARLNDGFPDELAKNYWDVILVDAPVGWKDSDPGRMKSIYIASRLAKINTQVFVHDCDREVEKAYCDRFFGRNILQSVVGRLRHYSV